MDILFSSTTFELSSGVLRGENTESTVKQLAQLQGVFGDETAFRTMNQSKVIYEVTSHMQVTEGKSGGLFFGVSKIHPGTVGNEYFMTKGHFHEKRDTGEYYFGISGSGLLLLMDEAGECSAQRVVKNSLHYIPGNIAHRLVNTGGDMLVVGACWPADAGHDYDSMLERGFPVRVCRVSGEAALILNAEYTP